MDEQERCKRVLVSRAKGIRRAQRSCREETPPCSRCQEARDVIENLLWICGQGNLPTKGPRGDYWEMARKWLEGKD